MGSINFPITKRHPPRLTATDRTLSVAIENYAPVQTSPTLSAIVSNDPKKSSTSLHNISKPEKLFYMGRSTNNDELGARLSSQKPIIKRSDTLGICNASLYESGNYLVHKLEKKSPSMLTKRTSSMRQDSAATKEYSISNNSELPDPTRRNCRMHRSFKDLKKTSDQRKDIIIETIKYHSFGDEADNLLDANQKLSEHFRSANVSLENDTYRSASNSRNQLSPDNEIDAIQSLTYKLSSQSLEEKQYSFQRNTKHAHSFYISPNTTSEEFKIACNPRLQYDRRQILSMRSRSFRDVIDTSKKSKNFINDSRIVLDRSPIMENRRASKILASIDDIKYSPRLSDNLLFTPDNILSTAESRKSSTIDISELDSSDIIRPYHENRRKKSSALSVNHEVCNNEEFLRKRNTIFCIILTVLCSLVFVCMFVVIFTLTHSTDAQVQNQTRKVYTFSKDRVASRDRVIPIHYNGK